MHTRPKSFARVLIAEVQAVFNSIGLNKRSQNEFTMELNDEVIGRVSFAITNVGDQVLSINLGVAVRHQTLEALLAELSEQAFHPYRIGTIGGNIGYMTAQKGYFTFDFVPGEKHEYKVREMADIMKQEGSRWMHAHSTLDAILREILSGYRFITRDAAQLRLPVIYYLKKNFNASHEFLKKGLAEIGQNQGPVSDQYRRLAKALLPRISGTL